MEQRGTATAIEAREPLGTLTAREREVLDLIAAGKTNAEIATALGLAFPTAKNHVSRILSKLDVDTREEAAIWWRAHRNDQPRVSRARWLRALIPTLPWRGPAQVVGVTLAATAIGALTLLAAVAFVQRGDDGAAPPATDATMTSSASSTGTPAATSTPNATPSPTTGSNGEPIPVVTLDASPRERPPDVVRKLAPRPESPFAPWDRTSTVIYDVETGTERNLGPGSLASFSPDSTRAAWIAGDDGFSEGEARVIDLATGEVTVLGPGRLAYFRDNEHVVLIVPESNGGEAMNLATGERVPTSLDGDVYGGPPEPNYFTFTSSPWPGEKSDADYGSYLPRQIREGDESGEVLFEVEAFQLVGASAGTVVAAGPVAEGRSNIYLIDTQTRAATFIGGASVPNVDRQLQIAANEDYVMWTEGICGLDEPRMWLYDRTANTLTRIDMEQVDEDDHYRLLTPAFTTTGLIAAGAFGPRTLLDPETLAYVAVLPDTGDVRWSTDWRYASAGQWPGHGGLCL